MSIDKEEKSIERIIEELVRQNDRVGFPQTSRDDIEIKRHGWFYPPHRVTLAANSSEKTRVIIELGAWLGRSTIFYHEVAPNAIIFAIDIWSNEFSLADNHYTGCETNVDILKNIPLIDQFTKNTWHLRYTVDQTGTGRGIVPMHMTTLEGLKILKDLEIEPDIIYIDADHHYEPAKKDIDTCITYFPGAAIVGDDWDYEDVRKAAIELKEKSGKRLHVEGQKCWSYTNECVDRYIEKRKLFGDVFDEKNIQLFKPAFAVIQNDDNYKKLKQILDGSSKALPVDTIGHFKGRTLLMQAAYRNRYNCVKLLLVNYNANPNVTTTSRSETALGLAAYHGYERILELLLKHGADTSIRNEFGETALEAARANKKNLCIDMIEMFEAGTFKCARSASFDGSSTSDHVSGDHKRKRKASDDLSEEQDSEDTYRSRDEKERENRRKRTKKDKKKDDKKKHKKKDDKKKHKKKDDKKKDDKKKHKKKDRNGI